MVLQALWASLEASPVGSYISASSWAFPTLETIHVIAIVTVIGTVAIMDLRLLGLASRDCGVTQISKDTLPWTWGAFLVAVTTGGLLFSSKATEYIVNANFQWKIVFIVLAGVNMAIFHVFTWRSVGKWDSDCAVPLPGKIAGALSLLLWILVVFFARAIGFTLDLYSSS